MLYYCSIQAYEIFICLFLLKNGFNNMSSCLQFAKIYGLKIVLMIFVVHLHCKMN
jgi:hypothetical protein